jgi:predicted nucleic acid-binding protein
MKRMLVDTNVVLDVLFDRQPHVESSAQIWAEVEARRSEGYVPAHAIMTVYYLVQKQLGRQEAGHVIALLVRVFRIAAVDGGVIEQALRSSIADFEDAVVAAAAHVSGCDFIVTRDPRGFRGSPIRALAPEAALPLLDA